MKRALFATLLFASGCCNVPPPVSRVPTGQAAIDRMRATLAGCNGVRANAVTLEISKTYALIFSASVRTDFRYYASLPSRLRMDVVSPFGVVLATMTADGDRFALADLRDGRFYVGPARACAVERLARVPVPPHALVSILRGEAPVLVHDRADIAWSRRGHYVVTIPSTRDASEEILLAPAPEDFGKPWNEQRLRVVGVTVRQHGDVLYEVELSDHTPAPMAEPYIDETGLEPPIPPSGPKCSADLPRVIRIDVPEATVELRTKEVVWNPPLPEGIFAQAPDPGLALVRLRCE
jgi:hypothetical protein